MQSFGVDENGWATGAITPLPIDEAITLLSPEASSRVDAARWAHQAEVFFRARLTVVQDKRYPTGAHPLADQVEIDISQSGAAPTRVRLITVPVDRAPFAVAAGAAAARAIGGAGFDVLVTRAKRVWQAQAAVDAGLDVVGDPAGTVEVRDRPRPGVVVAEDRRPEAAGDGLGPHRPGGVGHDVATEPARAAAKAPAFGDIPSDIGRERTLLQIEDGAARVVLQPLAGDPRLDGRSEALGQAGGLVGECGVELKDRGERAEAELALHAEPQAELELVGEGVVGHGQQGGIDAAMHQPGGRHLLVPAGTEAQIVSLGVLARGLEGSAADVLDPVGGADGGHGQVAEPASGRGPVLGGKPPSEERREDHQFDGGVHNRGFKARQTVSATILCPSAVGWMPSGRFSSGTPPTPSSRKGMRVTAVRWARAGYMAANWLV